MSKKQPEQSSSAYGSIYYPVPVYPVYYPWPVPCADDDGKRPKSTLPPPPTQILTSNARPTGPAASIKPPHTGGDVNLPLHSNTVEPVPLPTPVPTVAPVPTESIAIPVLVQQDLWGTLVKSPLPLPPA